MEMRQLLLVTLVISIFLGVMGCNADIMGSKHWLGQEISVDAVQSIQLSNLNGELVKEYTQGEFASIIASLNEASIDDSAYIEMITGYTMTISLADGEIRLISYGSETNIVATVRQSNNNKSFHLVCPDVAKILIADVESVIPEVPTD